VSWVWKLAISVLGVLVFVTLFFFFFFSRADDANNNTTTEYAQVTRMLGNGRVEAFCFDGTKRLAHIRGNMRNKVWVNLGDIVLLGLRDYQEDKADIILKYSADEARTLKSYGELPDTAKIHETAEVGGAGDEEEIPIEFTDEAEDIDLEEL
jgi:translation initiation factor 1A